MKATPFVPFFLCLLATLGAAQEKASSTTVTTTRLESPEISLNPPTVRPCETYVEQAVIEITDTHDGKHPRCTVEIFNFCKDLAESARESPKVRGMHEAHEREEVESFCRHMLPLPGHQCLYTGECAALDGHITELQRLQSWVDGKSGVKK